MEEVTFEGRRARVPNLLSVGPGLALPVPTAVSHKKGIFSCPAQLLWFPLAPG